MTKGFEEEILCN